MRKALLFWSVLGLASPARAQAPWAMLNTPNSNMFTPQNIVQVHTLSPTLMWGLVSDRLTTASIPNLFIVTNNPLGAANQFDFGYIQVTGNATVGNISGISATTAVAAAYPGPTFNGPAGYGGEIVRTNSGGQTWRKVTIATQFTGAGAFCNWVHMFNATTGVALGNPHTTGGGFEMLRTTDGGLTWNSVANVPVPLLNERGEPGAFFASDSAPGTLWAGLGSSVETNTVRTFKTVDYGLTWSVSQPIPNIVGAVTHLAFKANNLEGLAYGFAKRNGTVTAVNVAKTTDGGSTWAAITPLRTLYGSFFLNSIDAVGNIFYSTGPRDAVPAANFLPEDYGTSTSIDGINWTNLSIYSPTPYYPGYVFCMDLITQGPTTRAVGYGGLYTDPNGMGGMYRYNPSIVNATRDTALQSALTVAPNPSATGVFNVSFGAPLPGNTQVEVHDALGRTVLTQPLTTAAAGTRLDLHREKPDVYVLQLRTATGLATRKLVIE